MNITRDRLCANEPDIASKIMDGEAVLINLQTGAYYSLTGVGAAVWGQLRAHSTADELVETLATHYEHDRNALETDLLELLNQLAAETLIRSSESERPESSGNSDDAPFPAEYGKPALEKFSDMEDLLALDPPTPGALDNLMRQPLVDSGD